MKNKWAGLHKGTIGYELQRARQSRLIANFVANTKNLRFKVCLFRIRFSFIVVNCGRML